MNENTEREKAPSRKKSGSWLPFLIFIAVFLAFYYISGVRLCAVVSGSMEPNLPTWSLCVVSTRVPYEQIEEGDIVVYVRRSDGKRIIHRVIAITEEGMVTKGDHNQIDDGLSITAAEDNLYGKSLFFVPYLGRLPMLMRTPWGIAVGAVIVAALVVSTILDEKKKKETDEDPVP